MATPPQNDDVEITVLAEIQASLAKLPDAEARVGAFLSRYRRGVPGAPVSAVAPSPLSVTEYTHRELPGVARLTDAGDLKITARDLKAKSGLDAAVRLAHVAIYAHERLTGQPLSSRKGLTPLLREWRLYDGNSRARLAKERGIIRSGDALSLDAHARRDAERFVEEILSDEVAGQWRPR